MYKYRLIPKLQMKMSAKTGTSRMVLVTTIKFGEAVEIGDPVSQAKIYQAQAADELIFVDIDASAESRGTVVDIIKEVSEEVFMPITVGGGVSSVEDFRTLLSNGADKVAVNSAAVKNPELINAAADRFGAQCVVLSIDSWKNPDGSYCIKTHGGAKDLARDPVEWAVEGQERGAGEILLTSVDRDGTRSGFDTELCRKMSEAVSIPVILSGGCGFTKHFIEGFKDGKADAVSAGTYFCFKDENPMQTRSQIRNAGIPIRTLT